MSTIYDIRAREILDSRGNPTVEVDVVLADDISTKIKVWVVAERAAGSLEGEEGETKEAADVASDSTAVEPGTSAADTGSSSD